MSLDKSLVGFVLYEPNVEDFSMKLNLVAKVFNVIIIDNSQNNNKKHFDGKNIYYRWTKSNFGVAGAARLMITYARKINIENIIFFDQDTNFNIKNLINTITYFNHSNFGICFANYDASIKYFKKRLIPRDIGIFSGSILKLEIINQVGNYRSDFFMEGFDIEFSLRLISNNVFGCMCSDWSIEQTFGGGRYFKFFRKKILIDDHKPERYYYRAKSLRKIIVEYSNIKMLKHIFKIIIAHSKMLLKVLLFEQRKFIKFENYIRGLI